MESNAVVTMLAALAQPVRLQAFRALVVAGTSGLTPGALAESLGVPANTLSFHLKELSHSGLVTQQRIGRNIVYRVDFARMQGLLHFLSENCCAGAACAVVPTGAECVC